MFKSLTVLALLLLCAPVRAGDAMTIRIERFKVSKPVPPAGTTLPADAVRLDSIETLAAREGEFSCASTSAEMRTELSGQLRFSSDGYARTEIKYRRQSADVNEMITTNLMLKPDESLVFGFFGPQDGPGEILVVTLLKSRPTTLPSTSPMEAAAKPARTD